VIFQAGDSTQGRDLGAAIADGTFTIAADLATGQAYYADLKARAAALGRNPDHIKVLPGLPPFWPTAMKKPRPSPARRKKRSISASCWCNWAARSTITISRNTIPMRRFPMSPA
jgi:hypothetical protein